MFLFYLNLKYSCIWNLDFWPLLDFRIDVSVDLFPAPQQAVLVCLCTYCFSFHTSEDYAVLIIVRMEVMIRMKKTTFHRERAENGRCLWLLG